MGAEFSSVMTGEKHVGVKTASVRAVAAVRWTALFIMFIGFMAMPYSTLPGMGVFGAMLVVEAMTTSAWCVASDVATLTPALMMWLRSWSVLAAIINTISLVAVLNTMRVRCRGVNPHDVITVWSSSTSHFSTGSMQHAVTPCPFNENWRNAGVAAFYFFVYAVLIGTNIYMAVKATDVIARQIKQAVNLEKVVVEEKGRKRDAWPEKGAEETRAVQRR